MKVKNDFRRLAARRTWLLPTLTSGTCATRSTHGYGAAMGPLLSSRHQRTGETCAMKIEYIFPAVLIALDVGADKGDRR